MSVVIRNTLIFVMCLSQRESPISKNALPANVYEASTQRRGLETSQLPLLTLTPKRYETEHVFILSPKKAYICNASELLWNYKLTKRVARYRFRATLTWSPPPTPRLSLRQDEKTFGPVTFLSYSELISSSSSSSVFACRKRCYPKCYSRAKESNLFSRLDSQMRLRKLFHPLASPSRGLR